MFGCLWYINYIFYIIVFDYSLNLFVFYYDIMDVNCIVV